MTDNLPNTLWIAFDAYGIPRNYWDEEFHNDKNMDLWRDMGFTILKFTRSEEESNDTQDA